MCVHPVESDIKNTLLVTTFKIKHQRAGQIEDDIIFKWKWKIHVNPVDISRCHPGITTSDIKCNTL